MLSHRKTLSTILLSVILVVAFMLITLTANIAANAPASITNTATVQNSADSDPGNNNGSAIISVLQSEMFCKHYPLRRGGNWRSSVFLVFATWLPTDTAAAFTRQSAAP